MAAAGAASRITAPALEHFSFRDFEKFYEPSDDTFLLIDALAADEALLDAQPRSLIVEIGPGSGAVSTALARKFPAAAVLAVDINPEACKATLTTAAKNHVSNIDLVRSDLLTAFGSRIENAIDVLIFNPPYVPTPSEEVGGTDLSAAWAGGEDGREVIDRLLPQIHRLLSPTGVFYLLLVHENRPAEIARILKAQGFNSKELVFRKARNERLSVHRFQRAALDDEHK